MPVGCGLNARGLGQNIGDVIVLSIASLAQLVLILRNPTGPICLAQFIWGTRGA